MCYIRDRDKGDPCKRSPSRQLQNRESKTGPGDRSRYPRRTSAFREWRRIQDPENGAERRGLCDQQEFGAGDETGWLTMQSAANLSLPAILGKAGRFLRNAGRTSNIPR